MKAFYCDRFVLPLPAGHRFPMAKYRLLRERIATMLPQVRLVEPEAAPDGALALAHHPDYVARLAQGRLDSAEQRRLGFPWSPQLVERSRRSVGATIAACRSAAQDGVAVNLAGGTHHAHASFGEGFCCFNDVVVAARLMQAERLARRVIVVDLDVHQGNGTASIVANDRSIFALSMHGERNFPFRKERGSLDVALPDGTGDAEYLEALQRTLAAADMRFDADFVLFIAGADVYAGDRLGRLGLTPSGVAERDAMVLAWARARGRPVAITMGGGYCPRVDEIVSIHFETVRCAARAAAQWRSIDAGRARLVPAQVQAGGGPPSGATA